MNFEDNILSQFHIYRMYYVLCIPAQFTMSIDGNRIDILDKTLLSQMPYYTMHFQSLKIFRCLVTTTFEPSDFQNFVSMMMKKGQS